MTETRSATATSQPTPPPSRSRGKAIAAIAAGTALLLGGGGTYAYWSTQQALDVGQVTAGDLDLALGTASWTIDGVLTPELPVADPTAVRIVPGDVLTLTQELEVVLEGDTIEAILAVTETGSFVTGPAADYIDVALEISSLGTPTGTNSYRIGPDDAGTLTATVTVTFDPATPGQVGVNTPIDLDALLFSLTQASS